jgi:hypothetical protein
LVDGLMSAYKANSEAARSYTLKALQQSQEVQKLWLKYFDETTKATTDANPNRLPASRNPSGPACRREPAPRAYHRGEAA